MSDEALCIEIPVLIKAKAEGDRRIVELEASNESTDSEGDVILQSALLDAAPAFIKSGVIDIDHISEIGARYGIQNTSSWIVGVPTEVKDIGSGRTAVVAELQKNIPGKTSKADEVWDGICANPPVRWRASVYGFPTQDGIADARVAKCSAAPHAKRYVVSKIRWKSLAFTLSPVNDAITGSARIVTAKAFGRHLSATGKFPWVAEKGVKVTPALPSLYLLPPRNREELLGHYYGCIKPGNSPYAGGSNGNSIYAFREHFMGVCCVPYWEADVMALALMQLLKRSVS